jgi:uncharacterized protein
MNNELTSKIKQWFEKHTGTITAFSGGIDSALVLFLSRKYLGKERTIGVISKSKSLKSSDYKLAHEFCATYDITLQTIHTDELADKNYNSNPHNRCYFCKTHLYTDLSKVQSRYPGFIVLNGTNKDDFSDYRPGLQAATENNIKSPLAELGITKKQIREIAKHFGISIWNKPSSPCLSSRIPYGNKITAKKLSQVEKAEEILNKLGFIDVRVRHYGETCRIEVPVQQISKLKNNFDQIQALINELGFNKCIIDEEGLISGKLNRQLNIAHEQL